MIIRSKLLGIITLVVIFGGILGSSAIGLWKTTSSGGGSKSIILPIENSGLTDPDEISGSTSLCFISDSFDIPVKTLIKAFALPEDINSASFQTKDFESIYPEFEGDQEIGDGSMKWFVALYKGLPYDIETDGEATYLLQPAVDILKSEATLSENQIAYLDAHTIEVDFDTQSVERDLPEEEPQVKEEQTGENTEDGMTVAGKTTFADLLGWGMTQEQIEAIIGGEMPNRLVSVKEYCAEQGLSFGTIKASLQIEVDKLK